MALPGYGKKAAMPVTHKVNQVGERLITIDDMFAEISSRLSKIEKMLDKGHYDVKHEGGMTPIVLTPSQPPWEEVPPTADVLLAAKAHLTKFGKDSLKAKLAAVGAEKVPQIKDEDLGKFLASLNE